MAKSDLLASLITGGVLKMSPNEGPDYEDIPLKDIHDNPKNFFPMDTDGIQTLAESIQISGIQQPPTVTPEESGGYRLVAGHRRIAAVRWLHEQHPEEEQWTRVRCQVRQYSSPEAEELALIITNTEVRQNSWQWMAKSVSRTTELLIELKKQGVKLPGRTAEHVARELNISAANAKRLMYLEKHLVPEIREKWPDLPQNCATDIAHLDPEQQRLIAKGASQKTPPSWKVDEWIRSIEQGNNPFEEARKAKAEARARGPMKKCQPNRKGEIPLKSCSAGCEEAKGNKKVCCSTCNKRYICDMVCEPVAVRNNSTDRSNAVLAERLYREIPENEQSEIVKYYIEGGYITSTRELTYIAKEHGLSVDYLLGLTDSPTPPGWKRITGDNQPPLGKVVCVGCYIEDTQMWLYQRCAWKPSLYNDELVQMWIDQPNL